MQLFAFKHTHIEPEQKLWIAVIVAAWQDLSVKGWDNRRYRDAAHDWFQSNSRHFKLVCDAAGLNPEYVQRMYKKVWRKRTGIVSTNIRLVSKHNLIRNAHKYTAKHRIPLKH
jgi:hypothetical protein